MDMNKNRYGKPGQTPSRGAEVANPEGIEMVQRLKTTAARGPIPRNGTIHKTSWPKEVNNNWYEKPVQSPYGGTKMTNPDCTTMKQKSKTTAAEVCVNWADKVEPSRCQETAVAAVGAGTGGTKNVGGQLMDSNKKSTTARTLPTNCGEFVKPMSGLVPPVVAKMAPTDGTGVMHCQWIVRESVRTTEMLMPGNRSLRMDMNKNRYGKPGQTPSRGAEVANPEGIEMVQRLKTTAARGPIPRNGTIHKTSWPKEVNNNWYEKPVQSPYGGTKMTNPDCTTMKQKSKTTAAEVCVNWADKVEPSRCKETAVAAVGTGTGGTKNVGGQLMDSNKKSTTARTLPTNCGEFVKPMSGLVPPVVAKMAPTDGTGVMHCQWIVRESVRTTEMLMPSNYLEIPELRLPRVFLHLAEEARNVEVENDLSCCLEEVQPQGAGLPSPVLVTVMVDSQPIQNKRVLRTSGASTEMMTNIKYVGRCKPIDRADQVVSPVTTEQPVLLGLNTDARGNASADTGGPDVNSAKQGEPVDRSGPVGP